MSNQDASTTPKGTSMSYTEAAPLGPVSAGDVGGDDAVTEGFSRRFYRQVDDTTWATVDVVFYLRQEGSFGKKPTGPITLEREVEFSVIEGKHYDSGDEVFSDCRSVTVAEHVGAAEVDAVKAACAAFDPASITWDGVTWPVPDACWAV